MLVLWKNSVYLLSVSLWVIEWWQAGGNVASGTKCEESSGYKVSNLREGFK